MRLARLEGAPLVLKGPEARLRRAHQAPRITSATQDLIDRAWRVSVDTFGLVAVGWLAVTMFPPRRSGDALEAMVERLGGAASVPRLVRCGVCGHMVWRSQIGAHRGCLGVDGPGWAPPSPPRPDPVVGMVYASIKADSHEAQVSDAAAARNDRLAREAVDGLPRCRVCGGPLAAGQRGRHWACTPANEWPTGSNKQKRRDTDLSMKDTDDDDGV